MQLLQLVSIGLAVVAIGVLVAAYGAGFSRQRARLLAAQGVQPDRPGATRSAAAAERRRDRAPSVTRLLGRSGVRSRIQTRILRAGWLLRPSEFVAISALSAMGCAAALLLLSRSLVLIAAALVVGAYIPSLVMGGRERQRDRALSQQLPDALDMITASLQAGASLAAGLAVVPTQMVAPIAQEIERTLDEARVGASHAAALKHMAERTGNRDVELVVTAMLTQIQMGGNLTEILSNIAEVIRERAKLAGEIATATAAGKLSANILTALPFALAVAIQVLSPTYLRPLYTTQLGISLSIFGGILVLTGTYLMRRIADVDI